MGWLAIVFGVVLIVGVLADAFETVVLPRRVTRRLRITRLFYRYTWAPWSAVGRLIRTRRRREGFLGLYGPLSLLLLLMLWAALLVLAFALLHWGTGSHLRGQDIQPDFGTDVYFSCTTLFTLGLGDVVPATSLARALAGLESSMGLGFLALVISYLPILYQSFSRREVSVALLDARAGTPPTGAELLRRHGGDMRNVEDIFHEWEHVAAELLESLISYPVLGYFRSQHDNQSWLGALTAILDAAALCQVGLDGAPARQAQLTFANARHALVDLAQVFNTPPYEPVKDRLDAAEMDRLVRTLAEAGLRLPDDPGVVQKLAELRRMYEPYANALAAHLLVALPPWVRPLDAHDNWRTSRWGGGMTV